MYAQTQRKQTGNILFGLINSFKVRTHACSYKKGLPANLLHLWEAKVDIFSVLADLTVINGFNANVAAGELAFRSKNEYFGLENTQAISDAVVVDDADYYYGLETIIISSGVAVNTAVRTDLEISPVAIEEGY